MKSYTPSSTLLVGLNYIKSAITHGVIVKNHTKGDDWATTQTQIIASTAYSSADVTVSTADGAAVITYNPKSDVDQSDSALAEDDTAFLALDSTNQVILDCIDPEDSFVTNSETNKCSWAALIRNDLEEVPD